MDELLNTENLGKGLHIAHLNVRSMFGGHRFDMLKRQIESSGIGVFTLSETWLNVSIPDKVLEVKGYDWVRADRTWGIRDKNLLPKRGGGLACYVKKGIKYSESKYAHLNASTKDVEMLWLSVVLENVRPIVVVTVYRPPQGDYKKCCDKISEAFDNVNLKDNTDIFLLGDFNIHFKDKTTPSYRELDFMTGTLGLKEVIDAPTRISFRKGQVTESALDLIFTNSDFVSGTKVLDYNISDHLGVLVTRKKLCTKPGKIDFKGRSYRNYSKEVFQESLEEADWGPFFDLVEPNQLWNIMLNVILEKIERMCPMKSFKVDAFKEVWMTNEAIEAIKDKDRQIRKAKRTGKEEDWMEAKRVRNKVGRDIENLRADFLKRQQNVNRADPKIFWKNIASIIPGKKGKQGKIWLTDKAVNTEVPPPPPK